MSASTRILVGDCLEVMAEMAENSVDAIVTDPPYGLSFMGRHWDHGVPGEDFWREALRVAKPGAYLVAFGGTRMFHRLAVAIEDAGWDLRDTVGYPHGDCPWLLAWTYGTGFPKSRDVSKDIDARLGRADEREFKCANPANRPGNIGSGVHGETATTSSGWRKPVRPDKTAPASDEAREYEGFGTALKPAWEPIILARKPVDGTVADNVLKHGTGAINVDGCRIETADELSNHGRKPTENGWDPRMSGGQEKGSTPGQSIGRWPANLVHDGSEEVVSQFPSESGAAAPVHRRGSNKFLHTFGAFKGNTDEGGSTFHGDQGSAARFFYCAKPSKRERDAGLEHLPEKLFGMSGGAAAAAARGDDYDNGDGGVNRTTKRRNHHPTVKPIALMRWLCRLITPPGGTVLDPFMGSGTTGCAAVQESFNFIGIEREAEYAPIAEARIVYWAAHVEDQGVATSASDDQPDLFEAPE